MEVVSLKTRCPLHINEAKNTEKEGKVCRPFTLPEGQYTLVRIDNPLGLNNHWWIVKELKDAAKSQIVGMAFTWWMRQRNLGLVSLVDITPKPAAPTVPV